MSGASILVDRPAVRPLLCASLATLAAVKFQPACSSTLHHGVRRATRLDSMGGTGIRAMKYRKLRIAWSVAWGVVAVLLCAMWLRSYWRKDYIRRVEPNQTIAIASNSGAIRFTQAPVPSMQPTPVWEMQTAEASAESPPSIRFSQDPWTAVFLIELPYWMFATLSAAVAIGPW